MVQSSQKVNEKSKPNASKKSSARRILPQVIATVIGNLNNLDIGVKNGMPAIVIPALTAIRNANNQNESLLVTAAQASWIGSIAYLSQPLGCFLCAILTDFLGRKLSMILVNIPFAIGWYLLWQATAVWQILVGFTLLGIGTGFAKATTMTYCGEISEPSIRGVLIGYSNMNIRAGTVVVYILNQLMPWRTVALVCFFIPMTAVITMCFIPETPQCLLSKNRTKKAEKSLCWLRGWVSPDEVTQEFNDLQRHSERAKSCNSCIKQDVKCIHPPPTLTENLAELKRKSTLKPFIIVLPLFFLQQFTGMLGMQPYIVQIFKAYESPIAPDTAATILSIIDNLGNLAFIFLVRFTGKRRLYLTMGTSVFLSSLAISCYGFMCLPSGYMSFNQGQSQEFHLQNPHLAYIPMICMFLWGFCSQCGFLALGWMLLPELFPFKSRSIAGGLLGGINYALGFISKKTYYDLETTFSMPGAALCYCIITGVGTMIAYFILPETEGRTLEEIELHFSDNSKSIFDRKIPKARPFEENMKKIDLEQSASLLHVYKSNEKTINNAMR